MSPEDTVRNERENIEMLLPWYAAGTLEPDEMRKVDAYIKAHPELAGQMLIVREEMDETIAANEALGAPSAGAMDRLMARVARESPGAFDRSTAGSGLVQTILDWFGDLSPRAAAMGTAFAIAVICAQAITLGVVVRDGGTFTTATGNGGTEVITGTIALVSFIDSATMGDVGAVLTAMGASIVDGPKPGGLYRVRLSDKVLTGAERDALLERLRANPLVRFAEPAS